MSPKVSIITATHNAAPFIERTVACVLDQTWRDFEWVIVDDESSDDTPARLRALDDDRVRVFERPNGGPSAARNTGLGQARGELIALLDHDDLWFPERLGRLVDALTTAPRTGFASSNMFVGDPGRPDQARTILDNPDCQGSGLEELTTWFRGCGFSASTALVRREAFEKHGGWREDLWYAQDWELALRLRLGGESAVMLQEPLGWTVMRKGQLSEARDGTFADRQAVLTALVEEDPRVHVRTAARAQLDEWETDEADRRLYRAMNIARSEPDEARELARWAARRRLPALKRALAASYVVAPSAMDVVRRRIPSKAELDGGQGRP